MIQNNILSNLKIACTSLRIKDKNGNVYHGRTLEYPETPLRTSLTYFPVGHTFQHRAPDGSLGLKYENKYAIMALTMPQNDEERYGCLEGINSAGLSCSVNMFRHDGLKNLNPEQYANSVHYEMLGAWGLANCATVEEVKTLSAQVDFWTPEIEVLNHLKAPFHFAFYDKFGGSIVIEVSKGELVVYDNPTGVMTNAPELPWHLTNLNNYSNLTNIDVPSNTIGGVQLTQPDCGIATANIPSSNTSVGRFVKAFYYSSFAHVVDNPDQQIVELSHIMNNFDRPIGSNIVMMNIADQPTMIREYTIWIALTDLTRGYLYVRTYEQLGYAKYSFDQFSDKTDLYSVYL